jgi:hypothetical protein
MSLCPASPSLQWVPWDVGSPPSSVLCSAKTANGPPRGRSVLPLLPRSLGVAPLALCPLVSQGSCERRALPFHAGSLSHAGRHSCACFVPKEPLGSPKFPSHPCGGMPRSQTPVVSCILAVSHPGLLPSGHCTPSAFASIPLRLSS